VSHWTWQGCLAGALGLWAMAVNNITFATNDYFWIVVEAIVCAGLSSLLLASSVRWRHASVASRVFAVTLLALNGWTLLDAGGRRLPAILGW